MKTFSKIILAALLIPVVMASCKKKDNAKPVGPLGPTYPEVLNTIVTPAIIDTLKKHGMVINDGLTPPSLNGVYLFHPNYCIYDNSGYNGAGTLFADYKYKFSNQNNSLFTISVDFKGLSVNDVGTDGNATYISGNGNLFTIFAQISATSSGIKNTLLSVYSGEIMPSGGIKNFAQSVYMQSKNNDPTNILMKVGSTRIFKDQDGTSETQATFAIDPSIVVRPQSAGGVPLMSIAQSKPAPASQN